MHLQLLPITEASEFPPGLVGWKLLRDLPGSIDAVLDHAHSSITQQRDEAEEDAYAGNFYRKAEKRSIDHRRRLHRMLVMLEEF